MRIPASEPQMSNSTATICTTGIRWRFWLMLVMIALADQISKYCVAQSIPPGGWGAAQQGGVVTVIPDFFYLIHVFNPGAAWSMFSGYSAVLALVGLLAIAAILFFHRTFQLQRPAMQWILGLLCGGVIGNVIDRFHYGHVVDFIDLHFGTYRYPTFNIADSAICVGVVLYIIFNFRSQPKA